MLNTFIPKARPILLFLTMLGFAFLSACATIPSNNVTPHKQETAERHRLLILRRKRLCGTWLAIDKAGDLRAGTINFQPDGVTIIAPNGSSPIIGSWTASMTKIYIYLPNNGKSVISYSFSPRAPTLLSLSFSNGTHKNFARLPIKKR